MSLADAMAAMGLQPAQALGLQTPSGHMKLGHLKVAGFRGTTVLELQTDINDFCAGRLVTGPPTFNAGAVGEATFVGVQFLVVGTDLVAYLFYAD